MYFLCTFFQNTRLYYDCQKGIYYTYNADTGTYHFYSQVQVPEANVNGEVCRKDDKDGKADNRKQEKSKSAKVEEVETGSEDGEIIDVDDDDDEVKEVNEGLF